MAAQERINIMDAIVTDFKQQEKARNIIADLMSSSVLKNVPEFKFLKDDKNPILSLQETLRTIETPLQENPELLGFIDEFTRAYTRALKNDKNRKSKQNQNLVTDLQNLSAYLDRVKDTVENPKLLKTPEEYEVIIDSINNQCALGRLGPLSNVARQICHWAEHTAEDVKQGVGVGKSLKEKLWRIPTATGLVGGVLAATIMMYANYQPPTTIKIDPIVTGYSNPIFDENGMLMMESDFNSNSIVESLKLGCHSHIKAATFGSEKLADLAITHVFKDKNAYEDCIVIGQTSQDYYARFDWPVNTARNSINEILPESRFKTAFNHSVDKTHIAMKGANNLENAVVHPLISQFHIASSFALMLSTILSAYALAGLRNGNSPNNNRNRFAMAGGHFYANRLRYSFMTAAGTAAWMQTGEPSFGGVISTIPSMITYSVGGLLAGDTMQWAWNKVKRKDFTEDLPMSTIKEQLSAFSEVPHIAHPPSWTNHITAKNIAYGSGALALADALLTGGQGTGILMGGALASAIDLPYIFIEDIPIHIPFAIVGDAIGGASGIIAGGATGAYLLGKKIYHKNQKQPDYNDGPEI